MATTDKNLPPKSTLSTVAWSVCDSPHSSYYFRAMLCTPRTMLSKHVCHCLSVC